MALTRINNHLTQSKIIGFNSLNDLISFQNHYTNSREQTLSNQKALIVEEKNNLSSGILELEGEIKRDGIKLHQKLQYEVENLKQRYNELADAEKT